MRREERVTVQGPVKEQQPDGMSHRGVPGIVAGVASAPRSACRKGLGGDVSKFPTKAGGCALWASGADGKELSLPPSNLSAVISRMGVKLHYNCTPLPMSLLCSDRYFMTAWVFVTVSTECRTQSGLFQRTPKYPTAPGTTGTTREGAPGRSWGAAGAAKSNSEMRGAQQGGGG